MSFNPLMAVNSQHEFDAASRDSLLLELAAVLTGRERTLLPLSDVVKAAAVADFHLSRVPEQKVKKTAARISLELDPTPDILSELGRKKGDRLLIGFAAEIAVMVAVVGRTTVRLLR